MPTDNQRVTHPSARRQVQVVRVTELSPRMRRITFGGEQLQGFTSLAADDHIKLLFARTAEEQRRIDDLLAGRDGQRPLSRDYTPRRYDPQRNELDIDFVLHGDGPAASWAQQARPGQQLYMTGPRSSLLIADRYDAYLLIGDETALPAIARWLEHLPPERQAIVLVEIENADERQPLAIAEGCQLHWLVRSDAESLLSATATLRLPDVALYAWIACEANQARRMRRMLIERHGLDEEHIKAAGYWRREDSA